MFQVMQKQTRWRALALQDSPCLIEIKGNVQGSFGFVSASFAIFGVAVTQFKHMIGACRGACYCSGLYARCIRQCRALVDIPKDGLQAPRH